MRAAVGLLLALVIAVAAERAHAQCAPQPSGAIGWWPGEGTADDLVGGSHGTLINGASFGAGVVGQAFSLDGSNDWITVPDSPGLRPTSVSLECWFPLSSTGGIRVLIGKTVGASYLDSYTIWYDNGAFCATVSNGSSWGNILCVQLDPAAGTWHHITFTFDDDADTNALYYDGVLQASGPEPASIGYDSHSVTFGMGVDFENPSWFFPGDIDEPTIYGRALTGAEVQAIYAAGAAGKCPSPPPFVMAWGTNGSGNGQFHQPGQVAIHPGGNVYVADAGNHRIAKYTSTGTLLNQWGEPGSKKNKKFQSPGGVAVDEVGDVYVVDRGNHRIVKYTGNGDYIRQWGAQGSGDGEFNQPAGVACDADGNVYVVEAGNQRVQKFTKNGAFVTSWGSAGAGEGEFSAPEGIAAGGGEVYIADTGNDRVQVFSTSGAYLRQWGGAGSGPGQFSEPRGIAVSGTNAYVADGGKDRIDGMTTEGVYRSEWGSTGPGNGSFQEPSSVAVRGSSLYVVDRDNHRVQVFGTTPPPSFYFLPGDIVVGTKTNYDFAPGKVVLVRGGSTQVLIDSQGGFTVPSDIIVDRSDRIVWFGHSNVSNDSKLYRGFPWHGQWEVLHDFGVSPDSLCPELPDVAEWKGTGDCGLRSAPVLGAGSDPGVLDASPRTTVIDAYELALLADMVTGPHRSVAVRYRTDTDAFDLGTDISLLGESSEDIEIADG